MMLSWQDAWKQEQLKRISIIRENICTFGVKPLDDALMGFLPDDLIVIAADSGTGKSHIGLDIALHNAMAGRNVALYSIEGNADAAISRIKWKTMMNLYYSAERTDIDWDFRRWKMNMQTDVGVLELEKKALGYLQTKLWDNLQLYQCKETFTIHDFKESLGTFKMKTLDAPNLIIIDHLQYFTFDNPANELSETTEILREVKNLTEYHKIPVLLISHLRKKDKNRGLPNQEDIFGTSNIIKICSQCIAIAPSYTGVDHSQDIYPTFFRFIKSRTGLKSNYAVLADFHLKTGSYADQYKLVYVHDNQPKDDFKSFQLPKWAYKPPTAVGQEE